MSLIKAVNYLIRQGFDPYDNLALEAYLLQNVPEDTCVLYLWQNQRTVVIGKNQNAWKECRVAELEADGGHLARRLSGGGAVFHDLGNLNFTFLMNSCDDDVAKQLTVIVRAAKKLGIVAVKSGRNDLTAAGRKFSGNAFYTSGGKSYHHGTLLVEVDMAELSAYLNVDPEKLQSKGVDSVKSRVINLRELAPDLTIAALQEKLIEAFGEVYGLTPTAMTMQGIDQAQVDELRTKFASWDWKFGVKLPFSHRLNQRFSWGDFDLQLQMTKGRIQSASVYSDAMAGELLTQIPTALQDCVFSGEAMAKRLEDLSIGETRAIVTDIQQFLQEQIAGM